MSQEIPILIDPALHLDATAFQASWNRHPQARELGRLETRPTATTYAGLLEMVVIPALVSVAAGLLVELIKDLLSPQQPDRVTVTVERLPDGRESVIVQVNPSSEA